MKEDQCDGIGKNLPPCVKNGEWNDLPERDKSAIIHGDWLIETFYKPKTVKERIKNGKFTSDKIV